ncbi:MAG: glycosyltransferase family 2 protein [Candidatus Hermodarchaeota archaeon]
MNRTISVIIPAFNEEESLRNSINVIYSYLTELVDINFEVLIIENGSTDKTAEIAHQLEKEFANVRAFSLKKASLGDAYRYGILKANGDMITAYPVDLAFSIDFIGKAYELIDKYPIILGVRYQKQSKNERPLIRILISKIHTYLVNLLFHTHYNDIDCLKAYQASIGKKIVKFTSATGPFIEVELMYLIEKWRIKFQEIPINHIEKEIARHPYYILRSILKNFIQLFKFRLRLSLSKK